MNIPRVMATIGAAAGVGYLAFNYMGDFKTPGMKNIENRHAAAGGGHTHTPSIASKLGDEQDVATRAEKDKGKFDPHALYGLVKASGGRLVGLGLKRARIRMRRLG